MYTFAPQRKYQRRNDWGSLVAQAQQFQQVSATLDAETELLGGQIAVFVENTKAQSVALRARINELRPRAQQVDATFEDLEGNYYFEEGVPPEFTEALDSSSSGIDEFLDELESQLDEISV